MSKRSLVALLGAGALVATALAVPADAAARPDKPVLKRWANPGVAQYTAADGSRRFVMLHTTGWSAKGASATAPNPNGPWTIHKKALLTHAPKWARNPNPKKQDRSVWAPSLIQGGDGRWYVFYSALVRGRGDVRCIGTGVAANPTGPFRPNARPIVCTAGTHTSAQDWVGNERSTGIIDASPSVVNGDTVLTFKTQHLRRDKRWHTTVRLLRLDPQRPNHRIGNPVHAGGHNVLITDSVDRYIEENPSLIFRNGRYTLFTSFGWYGTRDRYWTRFRQNTALWTTTWRTVAPARLKFPSGSTTWGRGNAQVVPGLAAGTWHIFWNGQRVGSHRGEGPKYLYVGTLGWKKGAPKVAAATATAAPQPKAKPQRAPKRAGERPATAPQQHRRAHKPRSGKGGNSGRPHVGNGVWMSGGKNGMGGGKHRR